MADKIQAADAIRHSIKMFKALSEYADELEKVGSIEQAKAEAERAAGLARKDLTEVNGKLSAAKIKLADTEKKADLAEAESKEQAKQSEAQAKAKADSIIEKANQERDAIIRDASSKTLELVDAAKQKANAAATKEANITASIAELEATRAQVQSELNDITEKLAAVKGELSAFISKA